MFNHKITDEPIYVNEYEMTPELESLIEFWNGASQQKGIQHIQGLKKVIQKFPYVPQFRNYLANCYRVNGELEKCHQANRELSEKFPKYLFGILALAEKHLEDKAFEKIPPLLNKGAFSLEYLYPDRDVFHISEVQYYYGVVCQYYASIDDLENAQVHLDYLKTVVEDKGVLKQIVERVANIRIEKAVGFLTTQLENRVVVEGGSYDKTIQTDIAPQFIHSEIIELYGYELDIEPHVIQEILSLPRKSLIADLEKVLEDCIKRYEYFDDILDAIPWGNKAFPTHALLLLGELKSEESLDAVLRVLRQGKELISFWFFGIPIQIFEGTICHIAFNQLDVLKSFMLERNICTLAKVSSSNAVSQIAVYYPERRQEVLQWYKDVLTYFLEHKDDRLLRDHTLNGYMMKDIVDFKGIELMPLIQQFFESEIVDLLLCGKWERFQEAMKETGLGKREMFQTIEERYLSLRNEINNRGDESMKILAANSRKQKQSLPSKKQQLYLPEKKVGRNAPCPCGSGKKYKRCCGKK